MLDQVEHTKKIKKEEILLSLAKTPAGRKQLITSNLEGFNLNDLNLTSEEALSQGESPFLYFARATLYDDEPELTNLSIWATLTPETLNTPVKTGCMKSYSVLYYLSRSQLGLKILNDHKHLRDYITTEGLNALISDEGTVSNNRSPLFWFARSLEGQNILAANPAIIAKINPEAFNALVLLSAGHYTCVVVMLLSSAFGINLLAANPSLCAMITKNTLNSLIDDTFFHQPTYVLNLLSGLNAGIKILSNIPNLDDKVTPEALNTCVEEGDYQGRSTFYNLSGTSSGRALLSLYPKLCDMASPQALNNPTSKGTSALGHLAANGLNILRANPALVKKITSPGLNATMKNKSPIINDKSPLLLLATFSNLLECNKHLLEKITLKGLYNAMAQADKPVAKRLQQLTQQHFSKLGFFTPVKRIKIVKKISYHSHGHTHHHSRPSN